MATPDTKRRTSLGMLLFFPLMMIVWSLIDMGERKALPGEQAWAQHEIEKLALPSDQKKAIQADIAVARDKAEVHSIYWRAQWEGNPTYRAQIHSEELKADAQAKVDAEREKAEAVTAAVERQDRWDIERKLFLWVGIPVGAITLLGAFLGLLMDWTDGKRIRARVALRDKLYALPMAPDRKKAFLAEFDQSSEGGPIFDRAQEEAQGA